MHVEDAMTCVLTAHLEDVRITVHMYFSSANKTSNEQQNHELAYVYVTREFQVWGSKCSP